jgi:hypothetical protein
MAKHEWKVRAVKHHQDLESFAFSLETELNEMEKEGFEVQKLEIKDQGILLSGRRPARRPA